MSPDHNNCYKKGKPVCSIQNLPTIPLPKYVLQNARTFRNKYFKRIPARMPQTLLQASLGQTRGKGDDKGGRLDSVLRTFKDLCFCYFVAAPENTNIEAKIGNKDLGGDYRRVTEDWDQAVMRTSGHLPKNGLRKGAFEELTNWPIPPKARLGTGATVSVCFLIVTAPGPLAVMAPPPLHSAALLVPLTIGRPVGSGGCYVLRQPAWGEINLQRHQAS